MLKLINDLPPHVIGIHAFDAVTGIEYEESLIPLLDDLLKTSRKISLILILETNIKDFAPGMWCGNVNIGLKYFFKWKKVAVVTDKKGIRGFSDMFRYLIPGKYRSFQLDKIDEALKWVADRK